MALLFTEAGVPSHLSAQRVPPGPIDLPLDAPGIAFQIVDRLDRLEGEITLAEWISGEPADSVATYSMTAAPFGGAFPYDKQTWCARATERLALASGLTLIRHADFYPPPAPAALALPEPSESTDLKGSGCTLGRITVEIREPSEANAMKLNRSLRHRLDSRYGPGVDRADLHGQGAVLWEAKAAWDPGTAKIVTAYVPGTEARLLAIAYLPIACETVDYRGEEECPDESVYYRQDPGALDDLERMAGIAGLYPSLTSRLLAWAEEAYMVYEGRLAPEDASYTVAEIVSALERWLEAASKLGVRRRAAALFVADRVLNQAGLFAGLALYGSHDAARARLKALGASFDQGCCASEYYYGGEWLVKAMRLDSGGPVGEAAFLILLRGGSTVLGCGDPASAEPYYSDAFRCVIRAGEARLDGGVASAALTEIHLLVADAYRDIVALAQGAHPMYADSAEYIDEAPVARRKAILHYRQALTQMDLTPATWLAWREAWRLIAGLTPVHTRFYYIYD